VAGPGRSVEVSLVGLVPGLWLAPYPWHTAGGPHMEVQQAAAFRRHSNPPNQGGCLRY